MPPRKGIDSKPAQAEVPETSEAPEAAELAETAAESPGDGGAREQAMQAQIETLETLAEDYGIDADTLVGDLRDAMLQLFKQRPKPWGQLVAGEQRDVAAALEFAAKALVRKAVVQIASADRPCVRGFLKKFAHDGAKITATLEIALTDDETILAMNHASGHEVLIITADADSFQGQRRDAEIEPDQPGLGFEAGSDRHPADDSDLADAAEESLQEEEQDEEAEEEQEESEEA